MGVQLTTWGNDVLAKGQVVQALQVNERVLWTTEQSL